MRRRYQLRPNYARLWRSPKKRESWESDFRGSVMLEDGRAYFVGAAFRTAWNGEKYLSIYLRPKVDTLELLPGSVLGRSSCP